MSRYLDALTRQIGYALSLPERTVRSVAASIGGLTKLLTDQLFPSFLRQSTSYRVFLGNAQRFLIESVGDVKGVYEAEASGPGGGEYVKRKLAGNAVEAAGILGMHVSPLWIFAIASDALAGSKVYLNRLRDELKRQGVIDESVHVDNLEGLLGAMEQAARASTGAVDTPPLSRADLARLRDDLTAGARQMFERVDDLLPRFDSIWGQIERVAHKENVSVEAVSGLLSLDVGQAAERAARTTAGGVMAVGRATIGLVGEKVLDSYADSLKAIGEKGYGTYLQESTRPYLAAVADHYDPDRPTWTEGFLGWLAGGWRADDESGPAEGDEPPAAPDDPSPPAD